MRLSVISINLNNINGLRKTIESVFAQTFIDFEFIVLDGDSTDGSKEVIKSFNSKERLIKWISEPDTGVYQAMNKGIRIAKGDYLLFLNSGDFLVNENVLSEVFSMDHTAGFILGRCNISESGKIIHTTSPPDIITFGYLYEVGLAHQSTFIKHEMFEKYGLYREDFKYNADIEFWYRTIILDCCSTETLKTIVSDYNTDGISSKDFKTDAYKNEISEIYSHPLLQLFIPDYDAWINERNELQIMYWVKSRKILYGLLMNIYNFATWLMKLKKNLIKGFQSK